MCKIIFLRALELTVQTTIHSHVTEHQRAMLTFNEVLPEHYDIDLQSYTYRVLLHPDRVEKEGFVADLPNFRWTSHDCVVHYSNISTAYNMQYIMNNMQQPTSVPEGSTCSRTYMFEVPFLPSGGLFSTVYQANKRFVRREMQPVDASRGALVPPSLLTICSTNANASTGDLNDRRDTFQYSLTDINGCRVLYTDNFLITAPIPDASMPYNVITLVRILSQLFNVYEYSICNRHCKFL